VGPKGMCVRARLPARSSADAAEMKHLPRMRHVRVRALQQFLPGV
jgi:hypothetical protein